MKSIGLYFTLLVLLSNISCGEASPAKTVTPTNNFAEIKFKNEKNDIGIIDGSANATLNFSFSNTGNIPLVITEAKGNCHCVQAKWPEKAIKPGDSSVINVSFDPVGVTGLFQRTIMVNSNATIPFVELTFTGEIKPDPKKRSSSTH